MHALDVPRLQPLQEHPEEEEEKREEAEEVDPPTREKKQRKTSGPKVQDPYDSEDSGNYFYPLLIALGLFIPTVLCLCKL